MERSSDILTTEHSISRQLQDIIKHQDNGDAYIPLNTQVRKKENDLIDMQYKGSINLYLLTCNTEGSFIRILALKLEIYPFIRVSSVLDVDR